MPAFLLQKSILDKNKQTCHNEILFNLKLTNMLHKEPILADVPATAINSAKARRADRRDGNLAEKARPPRGRVEADRRVQGPGPRA